MDHCNHFGIWFEFLFHKFLSRMTKRPKPIDRQLEKSRYKVTCSVFCALTAFTFVICINTLLHVNLLWRWQIWWWPYQVGCPALVALRCINVVRFTVGIDLAHWCTVHGVWALERVFRYLTINLNLQVLPLGHHICRPYICERVCFHRNPLILIWRGMGRLCSRLVEYHDKKEEQIFHCCHRFQRSQTSLLKLRGEIWLAYKGQLLKRTQHKRRRVTWLSNAHWLTVTYLYCDCCPLVS